MSRADPDLSGVAASVIEELLDRKPSRPAIVGICGAQGCGKSTLSVALAEQLVGSGHPVAILSLDDLYLTRVERLRLAYEVHPLLATRGPPGTHDISLGRDVIETLRRGLPCRLPRFDKAVDDRRKPDEWPLARDCEVLFLEGWCVGAMPQSSAALQSPVNNLEASEDPDAIWRSYTNEALAGPYRTLFDEIDYLMFLKAPDFNVVVDWRMQQEEDLRARRGEGGRHIMNREQIVRFVQHYERLTRHMLMEMPRTADMTVALDAFRRPNQITFRQKASSE